MELGEGHVELGDDSSVRYHALLLRKSSNRRRGSGLFIF